MDDQKQPTNKRTANRILQICETICFLALAISVSLYCIGKWPGALILMPLFFLITIFFQAAKIWLKHRGLAILQIIRGGLLLTWLLLAAKVLL